MKLLLSILAISLPLLTVPATAVADEPTILTGTVTHVRDGDTIEPAFPK
jgi:endonuclease YncB( thermonuclease family)